MNDQGVTTNETTQLLKELISDLRRRSWNETRSMEEERRILRQRKIRQLWADDRLTQFYPKTGSTVHFLSRFRQRGVLVVMEPHTQHLRRYGA